MAALGLFVLRRPLVLVAAECPLPQSESSINSDIDGVTAHVLLQDAARLTHTLRRPSTPFRPHIP